MPSFSFSFESVSEDQQTLQEITLTPIECCTHGVPIQYMD